MNGDTREKIDSRIEQLKTEAASDHDLLIRAGATLDFLVDQYERLPCQSNDPKINPQQRLASVETDVRDVRRQATKNSATIGTIVALAWNGVIIAGKAMFGK